MKTLWNVLAILAVFNILAFAGLLGWLKATDRLSRDRILAAKQVFTKTITQEAADRAAADAETQRKATETAQAKKDAEPPVSAAEKIADQELRDEQHLHTALRQQQERDSLSLMAQIAKLEDLRRKLDAERKAFAAERKKSGEGDADKQFQLALATLEDQKPKDAKNVLRALWGGEKTRQEQVVAYLAKMDESKRSKIIAEFVKDPADGPALAADLLERLRLRGIGPGGTNQPSPAQGPDDAASSTVNSGGNGGAGGSNNRGGTGPVPGPAR